MTKSRSTVSLVTGGAGFLGFHLCKRLLAEGHRVICLDDLSSGPKEHVEYFRTNENFEFICHDVREPIRLEVDRIFNLACPASPKAYQADPIKTTLTNVLGMKNMLDLARSTGGYRRPFTSGDPDGYFASLFYGLPIQ